MENNLSKEESYCRDMSDLCGAPCTLLKVRPSLSLFRRPERTFCTVCEGCSVENTLHYGCSEAYRWNGKYVFFCPKSLVFVAASLADEQGALRGGLLLGPIVMGDPADTRAVQNDPRLSEPLSALPQWGTERVRYAEEILSAVASTVSAAPQSLYGSYVFEQEKMLSELYSMKSEWQEKSGDSVFLIRSEKQLAALISSKDKEGTQKLLNEMLGYIFLTGNTDISVIRARLIEMLVLLSRSAIDAGAGIQEILLFNEGNIKQIETISTLEDLSAWITVILHRFIQYCFDFSAVKHSDVLYKVIQYIKANYDRRITLDDIASHVHFSRSYISSMFHDEMGEGIASYINRVRVEKSKVLLLNESISLVSVSGLCGFDDQSYFTKVFKNIVGISPKKFRDSRGKINPVK